MATADELLAEMATEEGVETIQSVEKKTADSLMSEMTGMPVDNRTPEDVDMERRARIEALPEAKGILSGVDAPVSQQVAASAAMMTALDPYEMGQILESNFPEIGVVQTPENEFIAVNQKTGRTVVLNKPGLSMVDVIQALGLVTSFSPAGGASMAGKTLGQKMAIGAAASGATQTGIEAGQALAGGEFNPGEVPLASGFGAAGELIAPAFNAVKGMVSKGEDIPEQFLKSKESQDVLEAATGVEVPLYPAQQTRDKNLLIQQRYLIQAPETAKLAAESLEKQNKAVYDSIIGLMADVAPDEALVTGKINLFEASKKSLKNAKDKRKAATKPLYEEAFSINPDIEESRFFLTKMIDDAADKYTEGSSIRKNIKHVKKLVEDAKNLRQLHSAKLEIDEMLDGTSRLDTPIGNTSRAELSAIKDLLVEEMGNASPEYIKAMDEFSRLSKEIVDPVKKSLVGKIAMLPEDKLSQISKSIFDQTEVNPYIIGKAREMIDAVDPEAWDQIVRVELQRRLGGLVDLISDNPESVANTPGALKRAIFGNPEKRRVFLSALSPQQRTNFLAFEDVISRGQLGRFEGSPTNAFQAISRFLMGGALRAKAAMTSPVSTGMGALENSIMARNTEVLGKAMFDPEWSGNMNKIVTGKPESRASAKAMMQLLRDVSNSLPEEDQQEQTMTE